MQRLWALVELAQLERSDVPLFPVPIPTQHAGTQTAKFVIRDNLRHRRDIERAYLAAIRTAKQEIVIANAYFFPGVAFPPRADQLPRSAACSVTLAAAGARRIPAAALRRARAVRPAARRRASRSRNTTGRSCTRRSRWSTITGPRSARRTSIPTRLLMAREANVFVRDPHFADQLRHELLQMIGDRRDAHVEPERWAGRSRLRQGR